MRFSVADISLILERRISQVEPAFFEDQEPMPHVILHDLLPSKFLKKVEGEFEAVHRMPIQFDKELEVKSANESWLRFGPNTVTLASSLISGPVVEALSNISGLMGLVADSRYRGGGQHQIRRGGKLGLHRDFTKDRVTGLQRRLNLLIYLNSNWQTPWGGSLELWRDKSSGPLVSVPPLIGTAVLFRTDRPGFHGHPSPLECPANRTRRSFAAYYYSMPDEPEQPRVGTEFLEITR